MLPCSFNCGQGSKKYMMKIFNLIIVVFFVGTALASSEEGVMVGEGNDANRSSPVHLFNLKDEAGLVIRADSEKQQPFSTKKTCGECHNYDEISKGWHFNAHDTEVDAGRPGEPWVLVDSICRSQIPVTARGWQGTFAPQDVGITPWLFLKKFYSHFPGGSYGEMEADNPEEGIRQGISGMYEINCLACHNRSSYEDQSLAAMQVARQNYRWVPTASSGLATVEGLASSLDDFYDPEFDEGGIEVTYRQGIFDKEDKVLMDIGLPENDSCYFCHSNKDLSVSSEMEWTRDQDVHLHSGLNCIDCHRNGDDHMITRGFEHEGLAGTLSCEGCHIADHNGGKPIANRLGAPAPEHAGIPPIHFERLSCTACHSGNWPEEQAGQLRTARIHKTALHGQHNMNQRQPHIYGPVLMRGTDGKIAPHKLFWPSYWADASGEDISPINPEKVLESAGDILKEEVEKQNDWRPLTDEQITAVLNKLRNGENAPVYIAGGKMYKLAAGDKLEISEPVAAQPYAWPMAHDVRPAEQALGVNKCADCHDSKSSFFYSELPVDGPLVAQGGQQFINMIDLQGLDKRYMAAFNASFIFRPMLKFVAFGSCGLIALVVLAYVLKAIAAVTKAGTEEVE